jgi:cytochrome c oxidase subunit III
MSSDQAIASPQFVSIGQQRDAARLGIWAFLVTEVMFFGGMFCGYTIYRNSYPDAFAAGSHKLNVVLGTINTAVLIGSSFTMALAVRAAQHGPERQRSGQHAHGRHSQGRAQNLPLLATVAAGAVFLGIKTFEYYTDYTESLIPGAHFQFAAAWLPQVQLFFVLYFAMTGLHAVHMIIGMGVILVLVLRQAIGRPPRDNSTAIEVTGLYWHFVDVIWIFLFPLLYLV